MKRLRWREGDAEDGIGCTQDFEGCVWKERVSVGSWVRVTSNIPGVDAVTELDFTSMVVVGVEGVCCIEMYLYPPTRLPATRYAGIAHRPGWLSSGRRLLEDTRGISGLTRRVGARC